MTVAELKELAASTETVLKSLYDGIAKQQEDKAGVSLDMLEVCVREVYGRLDLLDLFREREELEKRMREINLKIQRNAGTTANVWADPKVVAVQLQQAFQVRRNGNPHYAAAASVLTGDLLEEFNQVTEERGLDLVLKPPPTYPRAHELMEAFRAAESIQDVKKIQDRYVNKAIALLKEATNEEGSA